MAVNALILSGGGARAAYQVGVLQALNDLLPESQQNPFPIICGTSAGAINALCLAGHTGHFHQAAADLVSIWQNLRIERVFRTGWRDMLVGLGRLGLSLLNDGVGRDRPVSLLDNAPLLDFIRERVHFDSIDSAIASGKLHAVCVTAMAYTSGESVSFFQGSSSLAGWRRHRRIGLPTRLQPQHLMASSAIPTLFPSVKIGDQFYGDGAVRQVSPISPALHLGADRIFVVGVSSNRNPASWSKQKLPAKHSPSMAQIVGHMFNSVFIDSLEGDIEHLERVNRLLQLIPEATRQRQELQLRPVETLVISPSQDLSKIAGRKIRHLPPSLRVFMKATGGTARAGGSAASSYLLFDRSFTNELIDLGYQDAMWEKDAIQRFFSV